MAKGNRGGRRGQPAQATPAAAGGGTGGGGGGGGAPVNAQWLTNQQASTLRQQQDSSYDANTTAAVKQYISNTNFDGQGHSLSQTMNFLLDNGVDLQTANVKQLNKQYGLRLDNRALASMQYTDAYMSIATHPIGQDINLLRGAHDDLLKNVFGISDYSKLSQAQLDKRLTGKTFKTTSYMSTSYDKNKNPFLSSSSNVSGGREVVYNIKAGKNTKMLFGARKQAEMILDKGTDFKITGVYYTGQTATPRGGSSKPQIIVYLETI